MASSDPTTLPTSLHVVGNIQYDERANYVAVTSGSVLNVTQSYVPVAAQSDANQVTPFVLSSGTLGLRVAQVGTRNIIGEYRAAYGFLTGTARDQNLVSIENPAASGRSLIIKRFSIDGLLMSASSVGFSYTLGRTNGLPTGGVTLSSQKRASTDKNVVGVIRTSPSASFAAGSMWIGSPGFMATAVGQVTPNLGVSMDTVAEVNDIVLFPGEALALKATANVATWNHFGFIYWQEAI